jgi:hypothetical protein
MASDAHVPIACSLGSAGLKTQSERWAGLRERSELRQLDTPTGRSIFFRPDAGVEEELEALVAVENECCAWASWTVELLPGKVAMHAASTGEGVTVLHRMFSS